MKKRNALTIGLFCILVFAVLFAGAAEFGKNYIPTHDGEYHIIRIVEFSKMLTAGYLFPRWAPTLNSGYGVPTFEYNYPLPNYIGSFLHLFTHDAVYAYQWAMGFGYFFVVFALFLWLESLFGIYPAIIGTAVGAFTPYLFVDMYIRGSIGEVWAIGFLCLTLYSIEKRNGPLTAFAFALLVLSHNILALIFTPFIFIYVWFIIKKSFVPLGLGLLMSAFFWLPALAEQKYVQGLNTVNFREHFVQLYEFLIPSWGSQFSGTGMVGETTSFQLGIAPIIVIVLALFSWSKVKDNKIKKIAIYLAIILVLCFFFMMKVSQSIWQLVPLMQNIQYPWRLLSFIIPIAAFFGALWVSRLKHVWIGLIMAIAAVLLTIGYAKPVLYQPRNEAYYLSRANFTDGTSSMGNSFSTIWTGWKSAHPTSTIVVENGLLTRTIKDAYLDKQYAVTMTKSGDVTVNILYFPGWTAFIDGKLTTISYRQDGIIHLHISQGNHVIRIQFLETPIRKFSDIMSVVGLVVVALWGILHL